MIIDLAHIALATADAERALAFYRMLGLREAFRLHHPDGSLRLIYVHIAGDRFLELMPGGIASNELRQENYRHLSLLTNDLRGDLERIRDAGIPILREVTLGDDGAWQARVRDPDGNTVELMQLTDDALQRSSLRSLQ